MIDLGETGLRADQALFNESQSRVVISTAGTNASALLALCQWRNVAARRIGTVCDRDLTITLNRATFVWSSADLHDRWAESIGRIMAG